MRTVVLALLEARSGPLIEAHRRPLHMAAYRFWERLAAWLLDRGYNVNQREGDWTPLDMICGSYRGSYPAGRIRKMAEFLRQRGAHTTPRAAVTLGEADWLQARHAQGSLANAPVVRPHDWYGGLLTTAVTNDRPDILELLLDCTSFDPDECCSLRIVFGRRRLPGGSRSRGAPNWAEHAMAEMLLRRGADPNPKVHDGKPPISEAFERKDWAMVELLERHGGWIHPGGSGVQGDTERARKLFADEAAGLLSAGYGCGRTRRWLQLLLWSSAAGEHPEIVQMSLEHMTWPRDDPRWWWMLWHPLFRCLECFRLVLHAGVTSDARLFFGRTILHDVIGLHDREQPCDRVPFAAALLKMRGARTDIRDDLLKSTPLGWGLPLGSRRAGEAAAASFGADPVEAGGEPWTTPRAWAEKMKHENVLNVLRGQGA